jgi:hypothetical protein
MGGGLEIKRWKIVQSIFFTKPCLNIGAKVWGVIGCYIGVSYESVQIVIIKQIT